MGQPLVEADVGGHLAWISRLLLFEQFLVILGPGAQEDKLDVKGEEVVEYLRQNVETFLIAQAADDAEERNVFSFG